MVPEPQAFSLTQTWGTPDINLATPERQMPEIPIESLLPISRRNRLSSQRLERPTRVDLSDATVCQLSFQAQDVNVQ